MSGFAATPALRLEFTPKLLTVLREGYGFGALRADLLAGLTVAIVAVPLSLAIAIASGVTPDRGLFTSIVGGFLISALGGSRFQIGGPAGAFIVLVAATVARHGVEGLAVAMVLSGLMMIAGGALRLGQYIRYVPYPVTVGFTSGIAVVILASQLRELFGITLSGHEPGALVPKLVALVSAWPTINPAAVAVAAATIGIIVGVRHVRPRWPQAIIAVAVVSVATALLHLPVATIGSRFGGVPSGLPAPHLPPLSLAGVAALLPDAAAFALLGSIESLLSAVVADSMSGARHRPNLELVAQGIANIAAAMFGGICVTGTIARTATNVRSGARSPIAGMSHAVFLLLFMLVAAPLASAIPLAALAGVLAVVCWGMAEGRAFAVLVRASRGDAVVVLATFLLTILRDLTTGILVGFGLGALIFLQRMSQAASVETSAAPLPEHFDPEQSRARDVVVHRISGPFFFGSAEAVAAVLDRLGERPRAYVLDLSEVPFVDSTAASAIESFVRRAGRHGCTVFLCGVRSVNRRTLLMHGVRPPTVVFRPTLEDAVASAHRLVAERRAGKVRTAVAEAARPEGELAPEAT